MSLLANSADTPTPFDLQNIADVDGYAIAITGMLIVFVALTLISLFLTALPKMLRLVGKVFPEAEPERAAATAVRTTAGDEEIAAAIGVALHRHRGGT